jgi:hypothetical protein
MNSFLGSKRSLQAARDINVQQYESMPRLQQQDATCVTSKNNINALLLLNLLAVLLLTYLISKPTIPSHELVETRMMVEQLHMEMRMNKK